jgi:hypothetical protein
MLKKQLDVHLNFDINELDELLEIQLQEFVEGVGEGVTFSHSSDIFEERPLSRDSFIKDFSGIYFLNDPFTKKLKNKSELLIGEIGEEVDLLNKLIFDQEDYGFHEERTFHEEDFKSWDTIEKYVMPFSTLLCVDRYILKGPVEGGNYSLFDYNFGKILEQYYCNKKAKARIVIVCQIDPFNDNPRYIDEGPSFEEVCNKIKNQIKAVNTYIPKPEIVLIKVPVTRGGRFHISDEHDRNLISNYVRVKSGDGFVKFLSCGNITGARTNIDFYSHANRNYLKNTRVILDEVKRIIDDVKNQYPKFFYSNFEIGDGSILNL